MSIRDAALVASVAATIIGAGLWLLRKVLDA